MLLNYRRAVPLLVIVLVGCAKQEEPALYPGPLDRIAAITINEVIAAGSVHENEFGDAADWLELYNAGSGLPMEAGEWYLTDDPSDPLKYELPGLVLGEQEHLVIWCDGQNVVLDDIHTSFHLAAEGEWLALVHSSGGLTSLVDSVRYPAQDDTHGLSSGRPFDGAQAWAVLAVPTPGAPNEPMSEP